MQVGERKRAACVQVISSKDASSMQVAMQILRPPMFGKSCIRFSFDRRKISGLRP